MRSNISASPRGCVRYTYNGGESVALGLGGIDSILDKAVDGGGVNIVHQWDERVAGRVGEVDSISENGLALLNQGWGIVLPVKGIEIRVYDLERLESDIIRLKGINIRGTQGCSTR